MSEVTIKEKCNQLPLFEFQGFIVRPYDDQYLWLENRIGEGTKIPMGEFLLLLMDLYEKYLD